MVIFRGQGYYPGYGHGKVLDKMIGGRSRGKAVEGHVHSYSAADLVLMVAGGLLAPAAQGGAAKGGGPGAPWYRRQRWRGVHRRRREDVKQVGVALPLVSPLAHPRVHVSAAAVKVIKTLTLSLEPTAGRRDMAVVERAVVRVVGVNTRLSRPHQGTHRQLVEGLGRLLHKNTYRYVLKWGWGEVQRTLIKPMCTN
jgi:hypothetical protein